MSDSVTVFWDDGFIAYKLSPDHPLNPVRLELTMTLTRELRVLDRPNVTVARPTLAGDELLELDLQRVDGGGRRGVVGSGCHHTVLAASPANRRTASRGMRAQSGRLARS